MVAQEADLTEKWVTFMYKSTILITVSNQMKRSYQKLKNPMLNKAERKNPEELARRESVS